MYQDSSSWYCLVSGTTKEGTDEPATDGPSTDGPETDGLATDGPATDEPANEPTGEQSSNSLVTLKYLYCYCHIGLQSFTQELAWHQMVSSHSME